jgi:hypothetical protein
MFIHLLKYIKFNHYEQKINKMQENEWILTSEKRPNIGDHVEFSEDGKPVKESYFISKIERVCLRVLLADTVILEKVSLPMGKTQTMV